MNNTTYKYLLKKYGILNNNDDLEYKSMLSGILHRLNKDKRLNEVDKEWLYNKHMFKLLEIIEFWEIRGKANFNILPLYSFFPDKDYTSTSHLKKEVLKYYTKLIEFHKNIGEEEMNDELIGENKKNYLKKESKKTVKAKPKKINEQTTGHNIRKPHMA